MSFTWLADRPLRTREQIAREVHQVSLARGLDELATAMCLMCIDVEVGADDADNNRQWWCPGNRADPCFTDNPDQYPHDSESDDGLSSGYYQQQMSAPDANPPWGWGGLYGDCNGTRKRMDLAESTDMFLAALPNDYRRAADNPRLAGQFVADVQQPNPKYRNRYETRWDEAWAVLRRALATNTTPKDPTTVGWTGDPTWLETVLREALGDRLQAEPDWRERGTGTGVNGTNQMGDIWGVMIHHTGNDQETIAGIRDGRPDLAGPLSQCLITPDGVCHLIAIGPCNHAGIGTHPGFPPDTANQHLIGFECAWPTIREDGSYDEHQRWPDAQIITMRDATTAVLDRLGHDSSHVIGHKEYSTYPPNVKWDPGNIDMDWFRGEVQKDLDGYQFPGEQPTDDNAVQAPSGPPSDLTDRELLEDIWEQLRGPGGHGWPQLGKNSQGQNLSLVDAIASLRNETPARDARGRYTSRKAPK